MVIAEPPAPRPSMVRTGGTAAIADALLPPMSAAMDSSWGDMVGSLASVDLGAPLSGPEPRQITGELDIAIDEGPMVDGLSADLPRIGVAKAARLGRRIGPVSLRRWWSRTPSS